MFTGKVALVTGGSRGIGKAIVRMLCLEGANTAFTYLKSDREAEELAEELQKAKGEAFALKTDVRDFSRSKELVEAVKEKFGRLDILVNNAGIIKDKALMMMTEADWHDVIDTNLGGTFNVTRNAVVSFLKEKSGSIINITSITGIIGMARQTNYAASKAGIIGFTKALAKEVAPFNIRVNAVAPGFIDTDMLVNLKDEYRKKLAEHIPLGRMGAADDVANAVKFLLSEAAAFITGQVLVVDGGLSIR